MQFSDSAKAVFFAIGLGAVAGAVIGVLIVGSFYLLAGGTAGTRGDSAKVVVLVIALFALAGALQGYSGLKKS